MAPLKEILSRLRAILKRISSKRWSILAPACASVSIYLLLKSDRIALLLPAGLIIAGGTSALKIQPHRLIRFYFLYLMFEGGLKIVSNYNPVVHIGSDIFLIVIFFRLLARFSRETNHDLTPRVRMRFDRVASFLAIFWVWVLVQFFNPWGLGLVPSLAGLKIHVVPMLMFFVVGYLLTNDELKSIPPLLLAMGLFQAALALFDWWLGPGGLPSLHPRYDLTVAQFLQGFPYRPFGTTNLPGAPAIWMFHTLTGAFICFNLAEQKDASVARPKLWVRLFTIFLPLAIGTLVVCQVRLALLRFFVLMLFGFLFLGRKYASFALVGVLLIPLALSFAPKKRFEELVADRSDTSNSFRLSQALARISSVQDPERLLRARGGFQPYLAALDRGRITLAGFGLSRAAAAAAPWAQLIARDPYFHPDWTFSDNVFLSLFTELGLGGLVSWVLLIAAVLWHLIHIPTGSARLAAVACVIMFLSGFATEGILFQPDASFFWFYAAIGLRSPGKGAEA